MMKKLASADVMLVLLVLLGVVSAQVNNAADGGDGDGGREKPICTVSPLLFFLLSPSYI